MLKETGILLSCSYDRFVIAWRYQTMQSIWKVKKREELRCMDYISQSKLLLVGTNCHEKTEHDGEMVNMQKFGDKPQSILTINIDHLLDQQINNLNFSETSSQREEGKMPDLTHLGDKGFNVDDLINQQENGYSGKYDENNIKHVEEMLKLAKKREE